MAQHQGSKPMALAPPVHTNGTDEHRLLDLNRLTKSEMQPSYAQDMSSDLGPDGWYGNMTNCLGGCIGNIGSIPICVCFPNPYKKVSRLPSTLLLSN